MLNSTVVIVIVLWVLAGAIPALLMMRRGHHSGYWLLVGVGLGPFAAPVLWERMETDAPAAAELSSGSPVAAEGLSVVVGVDGSADSDRAARWASRHLTAAASTLTLVRVVDFDVHEGRRVQVGEELRQLASELGGVDPQVVVLTGKPLDEIKNFVAQQGGDLLVVGPRGAGLRKAVLGSVAAGLLDNTHCAVLVVPPAS